MSQDQLPRIVQQIAEQFPGIWDAYNNLGQAAAAAGPLESKTERLVKLALAVGSGQEGAVHAHVRRALASGVTREELRHVALLAITTLGWPSAIAALSWIDDQVGQTE